VSFIEGPVALGGIEVSIEDDDIKGVIDHLAEENGGGSGNDLGSSPAFSALPFQEALETIASDFQGGRVVAEGQHDLRRRSRRSSLTSRRRTT
jgi:hypothetical protein